MTTDSTRSRILELMAEAVRVSRINDVYDADEIASDILAHLSREGMAVVPVEPTKEMWAAGTERLRLVLCSADGIWSAMLSASPYGKASMQEASAERAARSEQIPPGKEESK